MITRVAVVRRNWIWIVAIVLAALILAFVIRLVDNSRPYVPPEFLKARASGSDSSKIIVNISENSIENLKTIQGYENSGNYTAGLNLVLKEINQNNVARASAVELSNQLSVMASNLPDVRPTAAANIGLQAIIDESQIVSGLINYNNYTLQLLNMLRLKLGDSGAYVSTAQMNRVIAEMNSQANSINNLNSEYEKLMVQFDSLTD